MKKWVTVYSIVGLIFTAVLPAIAEDSRSPSGSSPEPTPRLILTGVIAFSTNKWAIISEVMPDGAVRPWTLREAGRVGELEVLAIGVAKQTVAIRYRGQKRELRFGSAGDGMEDQRRQEAEEERRLEFVRAHARFHEERSVGGTAGRGDGASVGR